MPKMKKFDPNKKQGMDSPNKKLAGPVGQPDNRTIKGRSAGDPRGQVGMFYEPDASFFKGPNTPTKAKKISKSKSKIGRSSAATRMVKKGRSNINKGIG